MKQNDIDPDFLVIDLFAGFGGTTFGFVMSGVALVIAAVNHDKNAILSHWRNHPDVVHFEEDIRTLDLTQLEWLVDAMRRKYPRAKVILWASLECTHFSLAAGGNSRDADSRTLANTLIENEDYRTGQMVRNSYVQRLRPDYIMIENVREFMSWGPLIIKQKRYKLDGEWIPYCPYRLDKKTKKWGPHWIPESRTKGQDYQRWLRMVCEEGYTHESKMINAADMGAYTSRKRYFGIFTGHGLPTTFPLPTHAAKKKGKITAPDLSLFGGLKPWKPVREVLDFADEGNSIFDRPLNENLRKQDRNDLKPDSLKRIYAGLLKHIAGGKNNFMAQSYSSKDEKMPMDKVVSTDQPCRSLTATGGNLHLVQPAFIVKYNSNNAITGTNPGCSLDDPCPTLTTQNRLYLAQAEFLTRSNGGPAESRTNGTDEPMGTITTTDNRHLVNAEFLTQYNGTAMSQSVDKPLGTISTKDRFSYVKAQHYLDKQYGGSNLESNHQSVDEPAHTLTENPKLALVQADSFITNYYSGTGGGDQSQSIEQPTGTITAVPKQRLITINQADDAFIYNPSHGGHSHPTNAPAPTVTARQDKAPLSLVATERFLVNNQHQNAGTDLDSPAPTLTTNNKHYLATAEYFAQAQSWPRYIVVTPSGQLAIEIYETDHEIVQLIKRFMAEYGIVDIKMRMLRVKELLRIQGFPEDYQMVGSDTDAKKFIGNSVCPMVVKEWAISLANIIRQPSNQLVL